MSIETRSKANLRKRNLQSDFDLNRSSIPTFPKQRRVASPNMESQNQNLNSFPYVDMSTTINSRRQDTENVQNSIHNTALHVAPSNTCAGDENSAPDVRHIVAEEMLSAQRTVEENVRAMVQGELADIRKTLGDLVNRLSTPAVQTDNPQNAQTNNSSVSVEELLMNGNRGSSQNLPLGLTVAQDNSSSSRSSATQIGNSRNNCMVGFHNNAIVDLNKIRVDKLGLVFNGNSTHMTVDDFVFRLEHLQAHYNIPWPEIVRDFHLLVKDEAREWYWLYLRTHCYSDWQGLRQALLAQYKTTRSNFEIMRDLVERKQQINESLDTYFHVMNKLRSGLLQPITDADMIKILKRNIKESVGRIIYPMTIHSIEHLRIECKEAERNFPRKDLRNFQPAPRPKHVSEMYIADKYANDDSEWQSEVPEEIAAVSVTQPRQRSQISCWNCKLPGHVFMECPSTERALFCYRCGKPNVITPKCPVCQQGNQKRGVEMTGNSRPSESPVRKRD